MSSISQNFGLNKIDFDNQDIKNDTVIHSADVEN